jgi:toxin ParE1/3/4
VDELAARYRRFRFQSHYIYYTEEPAFALIRAVIHCAQQIRPQLFE